jgi:uncharacterized alpha-E superfamily protein
VAELFLQQPDAPRSIFNNLLQMQTSLQSIQRHQGAAAGSGAGEPVRLAVVQSLEFLSGVRLGLHFDSDRLLNRTEAARLGETLNQLLERLYELHPLMSDHYFSHQAHIAPPVVQPELSL